MIDALLPIPAACSLTLNAIQVDPLDSGAEAEAHMKLCRACAEARVAYFAQEESPEALAPTGYFDRLPDRVLRKLPTRRSLHHRLRPFAWAAAAVLLLAVGSGAFWVGRANRAPLLEANLPRTSPEVLEILPDTPFQDNEDAVSEDAATKLTALSEEDANAVLRALTLRQTHAPVGK